MFRYPNHTWRWAMTAQLGLLTPLAIVALATFLALSGISALRQIGFLELITTVWLPLRGQFGLVLLFVGSAASTILALALAIPIGLSAALYLALYATPTVRSLADASIALLGGLPSVVIGLWAMTWIVPVAGHSLMAAILVLALMITPTFTLLAGASLRQSPADLVEAVQALGVSEWRVVSVVVQHARWGIVGAAILAAARGLGEAVAVSMVAGNVPSLPSLPGPIATLTTTLIVEFEGAAGLHRNGLYLLACLVLGLIGGVSLIGRIMQQRS